VAPRTAIGINSAGELLILSVNGIEDNDRGMNLTELSWAFVELGAAQAVNLDGGGSTTAWMDGRIINVPTCSDVPMPCERAVASIVCVKAA
jgi:exopolysaccharide biosynthesis protein